MAAQFSEHHGRQFGELHPGVNDGNGGQWGPVPLHRDEYAGNGDEQ